jgi:hypothetical protein
MELIIKRRVILTSTVKERQDGRGRGMTIMVHIKAIGKESRREE